MKAFHLDGEGGKEKANETLVVPEASRCQIGFCIHQLKGGRHVEKTFKTQRDIAACQVHPTLCPRQQDLFSRRLACTVAHCPSTWYATGFGKDWRFAPTRRK
jgi:hypothetical protein